LLLILCLKWTVFLGQGVSAGLLGHPSPAARKERQALWGSRSSSRRNRPTE